MTEEYKERSRKMAMEIDRDAVEFAEAFARENSVLVDYDVDPSIGEGYVIITNPKILKKDRRGRLTDHYFVQFEIKAGTKMVYLSTDWEKRSFAAWIGYELYLENRSQLLDAVGDYE